MKTYEIFTEFYSYIIQANNITEAIQKFGEMSKRDEIISIDNRSFIESKLVTL